MKFQKEKFFSTLSLITLTLTLVVVGTYVRAATWREPGPGCVPPACNLNAPVNQESFSQGKPDGSNSGITLDLKSVSLDALNNFTNALSIEQLRMPDQVLGVSWSDTATSSPGTTGYTPGQFFVDLSSLQPSYPLSLRTDTLSLSSGPDARIQDGTTLPYAVKVSVNKPILGFWKDTTSAHDWTNGRFGSIRADTELVGGDVTTPRTPQYDIDLEGTTNIGYGDSCQAAVVSGVAKCPGGALLIKYDPGTNTAKCRYIEPRVAPQDLGSC